MSAEYIPDTSYIMTLFLEQARTPVSNFHPDVMRSERTAQFKAWKDRELGKAAADALEEASDWVHDRGKGLGNIEISDELMNRSHDFRVKGWEDA